MRWWILLLGIPLFAVACGGKTESEAGGKGKSGGSEDAPGIELGPEDGEPDRGSGGNSAGGAPAGSGGDGNTGGSSGTAGGPGKSPSNGICDPGVACNGVKSCDDWCWGPKCCWISCDCVADVLTCDIWC